MSRNHIIVVALVGIVAATAGVLLARSTLNSTSLPQQAMNVATLLDPPRPLPDFDLVANDGRPFTRQRLQGRWSLVFFGFTNCPDVCPTTLTVLAQVDKSLQKLRTEQRPQVVLISVDPARDTPQQLDAYVKFFNPAFVGVTGTTANIESFTQAMGVPVAIAKTADGGYSVDHSGAVFLIDPQGRFRALFSGPHDAGKIAADYQMIVKH